MISIKQIVEFIIKLTLKFIKIQLYFQNQKIMMYYISYCFDKSYRYFKVYKKIVTIIKTVLHV